MTAFRDHFTRRKVMALVASAAAALPLAARAQHGERMRRISVLAGRAPSDEAQRQLDALRHGLEELGWWPGRNATIEHRWHGGDIGRAQVLARELIDLRPDIVVANTTPSLFAVRRATQNIPIVFVAVADPVAQGFVQTLARPGGNITGFGVEEPGMGAKWLELLREIAPGVRSITTLFNPQSAPYGKMFLPAIKAACAPSAGELTVTTVESATDIERAIVTASRRTAGGLIVLPDSFLIGHRHIIVALAAEHHLPAVYAIPEFAAIGGLIAYGFDRVDLWRRAASYVDRILRGEKPGDLPVQYPTKFRLMINVKTARALGLDVPPQLHARADEVIE